MEGAKWSFQAGWFECFVFIVSKQTLTLVIDRLPWSYNLYTIVIRLKTVANISLISGRACEDF